jgi:hypothetical protein
VPPLPLSTPIRPTPGRDSCHMVLKPPSKLVTRWRYDSTARLNSLGSDPTVVVRCLGLGGYSPNAMSFSLPLIKSLLLKDFVSAGRFQEGLGSAGLVASQGFEPQYAESESAVLPLNDEATGGEASNKPNPARSRRSAKPNSQLLDNTRSRRNRSIRRSRQRNLPNPYEFPITRLLSELQNYV